MFGWFGKKSKSGSPEADKLGSKKIVTDFNYRTDLIQDVVLALYGMKMISQPSLRFYRDDDRVFNDFYAAEVGSPQLAMFAAAYPQMFLNMLGGHCFGAGMAYTMIGHRKFDKATDQTTDSELAQIHDLVMNRDPFEVGLESYNIDPQSNGKRCIDQVIMTGVNLTHQMKPGLKLGDEDLRTFCWVMFNAGFTFCLR